MIKTYFKIIKGNALPILIFCAIFLAFSILNSNNDEKERTKADNFSFTIYDTSSDSSTMSKLKEYLKNKYQVSIVNDEKTVKDSVFMGSADLGLVIKENETLKIYGLIKDYMVIQEINEYISSLCLAEKYAPDFADEIVEKSMRAKTEVEVIEPLISTNKLKSVKFFFNFLSYSFMAIFINTVFIGMKNFNEQEINYRVKTSPIGVSKMTTKIYIGSILVIIVFWLLFMISSFVLYGKTVLQTKGLLFILTSFIYLLPSTAIAYFVAMSSPSASFTNAFSNAFSLILAFMSGIMLPAQYLPQSILKFSSLFPLYWHQEANGIIFDSTNLHADINSIFKIYGIQLLIALAFLALTMLLVKIKKPVITQVE